MTQNKKRRNKVKKTKAIPLVKGSTAASLAKKRASETNSSSRNQRRRKRSRAHHPADANGDGNGNTNANGEHSKGFASTAESLAVISKFHTLNKRLEQNAIDPTISEEERHQKAKTIRKEQEALGGLDRYQKASMHGAKSSKFVCADWVVPLLRQKLLLSPNDRGGGGGGPSSSPNPKKLRILDVGAIDNQYYGKGYDGWLDAVPIDLHGGQHDSVLAVDFFDYAHGYCSGTDLYPAATATAKPTAPKKPPRPYDAIVLSLVLNFQGDPRKRGDMLALAADSRLLSSKHGMIFVALPSASLDNSRYCDLERFIEVATNPLFGLEVVEEATKISSKLVLLAFRRTEAGSGGMRTPQKARRHCYDTATETFEYGHHEMKRLPAKPGTKRNNFAVILKSSRNRTT